MALEMKEYVNVKCDGGDCKVIGRLFGMDISEAKVLLQMNGWKSSGGCLYCPLCVKRIFG